MLTARRIDIEIEVVRDFLKMCDKLIYDLNLTKQEANTIAIMKFYAQRTVQAYEEAAHRHSLEMEALHELKNEFKLEQIIGYGVAGVVILTIILIFVN